ncbi:putative trans-sialidase, Group V [Trypanosoma cruzi]|uniref:Trans-sialidase, putative n=2 Tax=Trypanosoma cruzi TaxID=5693 RepID=Q4DGZ1_TRYCC|nr:trans-sialidase, putative [Trypanosoma cruzi]EAN91791.1 trans-sialidase, putative [Trypanosoma cruzi]PWV20406.1 putative trans-sialidase, Group V [Trypanosoma cruzi]|eukprot:XP_813642.1 trans-sialidase [Trypanosoma cruzi strain CL Brener]
MHSRVAAVKAPRTHNRRRVTGSSGRRREGGESEPQRPNMSRHLLYSAVLLLVVMVCCGSGEAAGVAGQPSGPQFEWRGINESDDVTVDSLGAPSLLKVGNDVFAVAEAQCKNGGVGFTGVASQLLTTQTAETPVELFIDALKKTQVLEEGASKDQRKKVDVSRPTTAVKGNDIYMLFGQYGSKVAVPGQDDAAQLGLLLVKGSVSGGGTSNKKIDWEVIESSPQGLFATQLDSWTRLIGSGGSGVEMKDETLVFPVEGTKKKAVGGTEEGVKTVSLIIYSSTDNKNWTLSKGMSDGGCSDPSVVEWEEGKLMMMTACGDGPRRVYESGDMGESWTEALGTLSRVWGNKKDGQATAVRSGFITATIDGVGNKKVMLVTLPVHAEEGKEKGKLHLWLTDNTHIVDIGPVSGEDDAAASSLLYNSGGNTDERKEELIALYEKKKDVKPPPGMVSVLLTEQLKRVKEVLTTWKEVDGRVSQLCTSLIAQKDRASTDDVCGAVKITAGLVGFLSGNLSGDTWRDEYLGVNATVNNKGAAASTLTSTDRGVTFKGRGAWAEWPVGKQGQNQLYHFANYNFTLVATASIDKMPEGNTPIPLIGAKMNGDGNSVLLGLSYDSERKWHVLCCDKTPKEPSSTWETETQYQVAIVLKNGTQGSVYVDGQRVGNGECALGNGASKEISHFYIGGDGENAANKEDVSATVTNVLLYNRPWDEAEIAAFNPNKDPAPSLVDGSVEGDAIRPSGGGQEMEEQRESLESSGVNGVSAPTVPSAKTSSGEEVSATQLVSEESSDGSKNVGGGSSPGSDAPVETREGGTDGQKEEEIHAQNGDVNATALSSNLGNVSQGNNTDAGTMRGSGLLPSLLLLLLGLWGLTAL